MLCLCPRPAVYLIYSVFIPTTPIVRYPSRGVALTVDRAKGVVILVFLGTRDAGAVSGIRVGDQVSYARSVLGPPVEQTEQATVFSKGSWLVAVYPAGSRIAGLALVMNE